MDDFFDSPLRGSRAERIAVVAIAILIGLSVVGLGIYAALGIGRGVKDVSSSFVRLVQTSSSPDGKWLLEVYEFDPGALGGVAYHVNARPATGGDTRVILYIDPETDKDIQWASDGSPFVIEWQSPDTVLVGGVRAHMPTSGG